MSTSLESKYRKYKTQLVPFAYNIIGDSLAAEDVVQEVLNAHFLHDHDHIQDADRYLMRSVINRSINVKKSISARKRHYIGQWLPVPVHTEEDIYRGMDKSHILDYSILVLMEKLNPRERAVFILKESFDFDHSEIAETLEIKEENSRQLYKRARKKLETVDFKTSSGKPTIDATLKKLTEAILQADIENLKELLAAHVQSYSDGGDMKTAPNIIAGRDHVSKYLKALYGKYFYSGTVVTIEVLNHSPALVFWLGEVIYRCLVFDVRDGIIENVYNINNPAKLRALIQKL